MKGAFLLWLPLIGPLDASLPNFTEQLINSILELLKSTSNDYSLNNLKSTSTLPLLASSSNLNSIAEDKQFNKALVAWVKQLTNNSSNLRFVNRNSVNSGNGTYVDSLAKQCILAPNEWYGPSLANSKIVANIIIFSFRTVEILDHLIKWHSSVKLKYSTLAPLAKTQASAATVIGSNSDEPKGKFHRQANKRPIQEIEDEVSQLEERRARMEKQMDDWIQCRLDCRAGDRVQEVVQEQSTEERRPRGQEARWMSYEGAWTARPIGVI